MSSKSKNQLKLDNNSNFPNNNTGFITPDKLRNFHNDLVDSFATEDGITILSTELSSEISRAISTEASLSTSIDGIGGNAINQEISDRISGDASLSTALSTAISDRLLVESSIITNVSAEAYNRNQGDQDLYELISNSISTEASTRLSVDASLSTTLSTITEDLVSEISTEVSDRTSADASLTTLISTEVSDRTSADASLTTALSSEISDRTSADLSLSTEISTTTDIAKGAQQAFSEPNYETLINNILAWEQNNQNGNVGQSIYIETLEVPDIWISGKSVDYSGYTYTTDQDFIDAVNNNGGSIQIGYYNLSFLETQKVNLTNYVTLEVLSTEVSDRTSADESLSTALSIEISNRTSADASLSTALSTEISDRSSDVSNLVSELSSEISYRISADENLSSAIQNIDLSDYALSSDLSSEISRAIEVEASLSTAIGSGSGGASALADLTDVTLTTLIDNDIIQYNSSTSKWENVTAIDLFDNVAEGELFINNGGILDGILPSAILSTEESTRLSADTSLSTALSTEVSNRTSEDSSLSTSISNETSRAISVEASLSSAIVTGGGGSTTLDGLTDVTLTTPADGQLLQYDGTSLQWINYASTNYVKNNADTYTSTVSVRQIITLTQSEYDAITTKDAYTMYIIII